MDIGIIFAIFLSIFEIISLASANQSLEECNAYYRIDCLYDSKITCEANGCCWEPVISTQNLLNLNETESAHSNTNEKNSSVSSLPMVKGYPWCFHKWNQALGYSLQSMTQTSNGYQGILYLTQGTAKYGEDISPLQLNVFMETENRLHVQIIDPIRERWTVPFVKQNSSKSERHERLLNSNYLFTWTSFPFGFAVQRVSTKETLFNSTTSISLPFNGLVFEDQYLEISSILSSDSNLFGIGEHIRPLRLDPMTYTLWNQDIGTPQNINLYGSHPFFLDLRSKSGLCHGVFMLNSNGMDIIYQKEAITYKMIGGIIDLYFFLGPRPEQVIQQYLEVIGTPYMIPYWSLGFHQCRWGYENIDTVETVVAKYRSSDIPLEAIWTDIDYMDSFKDFTFDPVNFPPSRMKSFADDLHQQHQYYIIIVDPGIHNEAGYSPYEKGNLLDIWIKNPDGSPFIGRVWPGLTVFPDWFHPKTFQWWEDCIGDFHKTAAFDGLWIDMNEVSNFCSGNCPLDETRSNRSGSKREMASLFGQFDPNHPPYKIMNGGYAQQDLEHHTVSADAIHYNSIEYNSHNLFGLMETWATRQALEHIRGKRAIVISRSTFASSGFHGGHWTGDTASAWSDLYLSISDMINFNFYGIPMIGADICGFNGDTTEELCARWIEVGAFYPFSRNHNTKNAASQELYQWPLVAEISRTVLSIRYSILPYYYTLFYMAHVGSGATVIRPLWFEFPSDSNCLSIDRQFMIGSSILISPVVDPGRTTVLAYLPQDNWYDFYSNHLQDSNGWISLDAPLEKINIHIRGGSIIPMQKPGYTTFESRRNPFALLIALNRSGLAEGNLYIDDGDSLDSIDKGNYSLLHFVAHYYTANNVSGEILSSFRHDGYSLIDAMWLNTVTVLGVINRVNTATINGQFATFTWDSNVKTLVLENLSLKLGETFEISWK